MQRLALITLLVTLCHFVAAPQSPALATLSHIPESPVSPFRPNSWTFSIHNNNNNLSDWGQQNPDENIVFYRRLEHKQDGKDWTIKVGKGGQLFSIKTPQVGEMIATQRPKQQWVDEVFQHTIPHPTDQKGGDCNTIVDGDIHQAGYYSKSDITCDESGNIIERETLLPHSFYSPLFNSILPEMNLENSISYITWPQHAHLPRIHFENMMLMHQSIRDLGNGVIEISLLINKWGGMETTTIVAPHSSWRQSSLTHAFLSNPDGSYNEYEVLKRTDENLKAIRLRDYSTNGWLALIKGATSVDSGIGLVFHKELNDAIENSLSLINIRSPGSFYTETGHDATIASWIRHVALTPGDSFFFRYYLVLGSLADIQKYGNLLADKTQIEKIETSESQARLLAVCEHETQGLRRGCPDGQDPLFYAYRDFIRGSFPLFLIQNTNTDRHIVTSDPYHVDSNPTNGKSKYVEFLGWALPKDKASLNSYDYQDASALLRPALFPATNDNDKSLVLRTSNQESTAKPGDLNGDGQVDLFDYQELIKNYGNPWTIFDYQQLIQNFGN